MFDSILGTARIFKDKVKGDFPVAIGTSVMLEKLFNATERFDDTKPKLERLSFEVFKVQYINLHTLARNILNALNKDTSKLVRFNKSLLDEVMREAEYIAALYETVSAEVYFYIPDYRPVYKFFNKNKGDPKINQGYPIENDAVKIMYTMFNHYNTSKDEYNVNCLVGTVKLPHNMKEVLITTHLVVDLFNIKNIPSLFLVESHTATVRNKTKFNNKYRLIKDIETAMLPFDYRVLFIMGDKIGMVNPLPIKLRREFKDMIIKRKWTHLKTNTASDINSIPSIRPLIPSMMTLY